MEVIDDELALEEEERFLVHLSPVDGQITIGEMDQVTVTILDDDGRL